MPNVRVIVLFRKERPHEEDVVKQIVNIVKTASEMSNTAIEIEATTDFQQFEDIALDISKTPILLINEMVEFTQKAPPVDLVRQRLVACAGPKTQSGF